MKNAKLLGLSMEGAPDTTSAPGSALQTPAESPPPSTTQQIPSSSKSSQLLALADDEDLRASGPFTPREISILTAAVDEYQAANNLSDHEIRELIQDSNRTHNQETAPLWQHICSALPHRQKPSVQKVGRRKFHNFAKRGKWTPEEEEELMRAYKKYPQRWKDIGAEIDRFPEDCRDRYRNYVKCGNAQKKDVWDAAETREFKNVVNGLLEELRHDASRSSKKRKLAGGSAVVGNPDTLESLIDWDIVSERMGRRRSRLQCRNKWEKLREAQIRDMAIDQAYLQTGADPEKGPSPRYLQAKANYEHMKPGDKFLIIRYIRDSLQADQRKYEHEIPWQLMQKATEEDCMWTLPERKICLKAMKKLVKAPKKGGFLAYLDVMLSFLEKTYPGQTEDYYDGPLEYIYTTVPKRTKDPRRCSKGGKPGKSRGASNASAFGSAPTSNQTSASVSKATSTYSPITSIEDHEDLDLGDEAMLDDGYGDEDDVDQAFYES